MNVIVSAHIQCKPTRGLVTSSLIPPASFTHTRLHPETDHCSPIHGDISLPPRSHQVQRDRDFILRREPRIQNHSPSRSSAHPIIPPAPVQAPKSRRQVSMVNFKT
ncbi:hypothetical protein E4T56_gene503 [Termitomyces sp. T112]|nr:hypothetical protein E4T56_gene503 [Termitomyces sp. T112]